MVNIKLLIKVVSHVIVPVLLVMDLLLASVFHAPYHYYYLALSVLLIVDNIIVKFIIT